MTIKNLRDYLDTLEPSFDDCEIICMSDAEGNNTRPLADADINIKEGNDLYGHTYYHPSWTASECCLSRKGHKELQLNGKRVLMLTPED
jgi:hypothetical protein